MRKRFHLKRQDKKAYMSKSPVESRESSWHSFKLGCVAILPLRKATLVPSIPIGALGHPVFCVPKSKSSFGEDIVTLYIVSDT